MKLVLSVLFVLGLIAAAPAAQAQTVRLHMAAQTHGHEAGVESDQAEGWQTKTKVIVGAVVVGTVATGLAVAFFGANAGATVGVLALAHAALVAAEVGLVAGTAGAGAWWFWPDEETGPERLASARPTAPLTNASVVIK
jgi:hypothetical protein